MDKIQLMASNVLLSEAASNPFYMELKLRMMSTRVNRNSCQVTEAFIDSVVANYDTYVGMPLCVDLGKIKAGDYRGLGHMHNTQTGLFLADIVGAFVSFEKVNDDYGISLYGTARIPKRVPKLVDAICSMYEDGKLNCSFEISAPDQRLESGVVIVDASENNR